MLLGGAVLFSACKKPETDKGPAIAVGTPNTVSWTAVDGSIAVFGPFTASALDLQNPQRGVVALHKDDTLFMTAYDGTNALVLRTLVGPTLVGNHGEAYTPLAPDSATGGLVYAGQWSKRYDRTIDNRSSISMVITQADTANRNFTGTFTVSQRWGGFNLLFNQGRFSRLNYNRIKTQNNPPPLPPQTASHLVNGRQIAASASRISCSLKGDTLAFAAGRTDTVGQGRRVVINVLLSQARNGNYTISLNANNPRGPIAFWGTDAEFPLLVRDPTYSIQGTISVRNFDPGRKLLDIDYAFVQNGLGRPFEISQGQARNVRFP